METNKKRRVRFGALAVSVAAAGIAVAGIIPAISTPASASVNAGSITIGYENNGADPSILSVSRGYFQKELGSGAQTQLFSSGVAALTSLASGQLPFMCGLGFPPVIAAIGRGVPLEVVYNQERYTADAGLVVRKSTGITTVKGLAHHTVGLVIGSQSSFELATYAKKAGLNLNSVTQVNLSPSALQSAWSQGTIDAAVVWDPVYAALVADHGRVLANDSTLPASSTSYNICVANKNYAHQHPKATEAFIAALNDGVAYQTAHPAAALAQEATAAGITLAQAKTEIAGYQLYSTADQHTASVLGTSYLTNSGSSGTAQSLLNNWKVLYAAGTVTVAPPKSVAQYVNPYFAAEIK